MSVPFYVFLFSSVTIITQIKVFDTLIFTPIMIFIIRIFT